MTFALEALPTTSTPKDYLRLQFDPSNVPAKRIVGLLACQRDPLLRQLSTRIISAKPAEILAVPIQKGKGIKKKGITASNGVATPDTVPSTANASGSQTPAVDGTGGGLGRLWEVQLEDTVIFPEGGGQPSDTGNIVLSDPNGGERSFKVEMCLRKKLDSVHLVRVIPQDESIWDDAVGQDVTVQTDWERRVDQMTIHTAQHLLSAILDTYNLPTLSWAVHAFPSLEPAYVELGRQLTWAEAEEVEAKCNRAIEEARKIWIEVSVQGKEEGVVDGDAERESRGLPKDYAGGVIRHVCIDQTDRNACCGTQLPHLGLCSSLHIIPPSTPSTSSKPSQSATKLFFVSGPRLLRYLSKTSRTLSLTSQALGCSRETEDIVPKAIKLDEIRKSLVSTNEKIRSEMIKLISDAVLSQADPNDAVILLGRDSIATHDFDFLTSLALLLVQSESFTKLEKEKVAVLYSAVDGVSGGLMVVQSKNDEAARSAQSKITSALNGLLNSEQDGTTGRRVKGGGAKGRYMLKIDGKIGKREKEVIRGVVEDLRGSSKHNTQV